MSQRDRTAQRVRQTSNSGAEMLPRIATLALNRALGYGEAAALAEHLEVGKSTFSRWLNPREDSRRLPADALPRIVDFLGPVRGRAFLGAVARAAGLDVVQSCSPVAMDGSLFQDRMAMSAAAGEFDRLVLAALTNDSLIDPSEATECLEPLERLQTHLECLLNRVRAVSERRTAPISANR